jgi:adenine-specific DNA methylase
MTLFDGLATDLGEPHNHAKTLGAFYTDARVADFLAWWAIRSGSDIVLDPCFGAGVFLRSACERLIDLGGVPRDQVVGIEIDPRVHRQVGHGLADEYELDPANLHRADFFTVEATEERRVDAVIGNPPFVRYQRFTGAARRIGLSRSLAHGVRLPELCSSWAPFIVHCIAMLKSGGRLAMVLPMEAAHAKYARPVLDHIRHSFAAATFLTFRTKLFPELSEGTLLLLADRKGGSSTRFLLRDFANSDALLALQQRKAWQHEATTTLDAKPMASGELRLVEQFIPAKARSLYRDLKLSGRTRRLGALADVGIGYVTGANEFFHLHPEEAVKRRIPDEFLKPAIRRGRVLKGLRLSREDWRRAVARKEAGLLLHIGKDARIPKEVRAYLDQGEAEGVAKTYKCRNRRPWYCVPHVHNSDAFLSYMSGITPRLVANEAKVFAPNSLHILRLRPHSRLSSRAIAALWQTSLTCLSAEIEGHALGGGMLKLEPTEAGNVVLACSEAFNASDLEGLAEDLDDLVRTGREGEAQELADSHILKGLLGLTSGQCVALRSAASTLQGRRGYRDTANGYA